MMRLDLQNDLELSASQITSLWNIYNKQEEEYGATAAILLEEGLLARLPEIELPVNTRAMVSQLQEKEEKLSVKELASLTAYPNPTDGFTYITYPSELDGRGTITVVNTLGQNVAEFSPDSKGVLELDMKDYVKGIYLVTISLDGNQIENLKIIKH